MEDIIHDKKVHLLQINRQSRSPLRGYSTPLRNSDNIQYSRPGYYSRHDGRNNNEDRQHDRNRERSSNEYTPSDRNMNRSMDRPSNRNFDRYILEDRYTPGTRDQMHLIERNQVYQRHLKQPRHTIGRF